MSERNMKWILAASLVLNIFLIGGIIGGAYHLFWADQTHVASVAPQRGLRFAADSLSAERQQTFRKTLRETRRDARSLIEASQKARSEVRRLMAEPAFDRHAVTTAINQVREADNAVRMRVEQSLVGFAETLSQPERQKLAEGLARQGPLRQAPLPMRQEN